MAGIRYSNALASLTAPWYKRNFSGEGEALDSRNRVIFLLRHSYSIAPVKFIGDTLADSITIFILRNSFSFYPCPELFYPRSCGYFLQPGKQFMCVINTGNAFPFEIYRQGMIVSRSMAQMASIFLNNRKKNNRVLYSHKTVFPY